MATAVEHESQLAWERRAALPAALAAFAAAVLVIVQTVLVQAVVLEDRPGIQATADFLLSVERKSGAFLAAGVAQALGSLALGVVFYYLFRATRHRRPETPGWLVWLVYGAPALSALAAVLGALDRIDIADQFAAGGPIRGEAGETRAEDLFDEASGVSVALGLAGGLGMAFLFVFVSLNAMRAGLLSRFMGVLGVILGALLVLPLLPGGQIVLQPFWLAALGVLFLGRWPGGRGPAWETGTAEPWPGGAERRGLLTRGGDQEPEAEPERERPASRKRKRNRG